MQELVGHCRSCGKPVYCRDGFLDGVVQQDGTTVCFPCSEGEGQQRDSSESDRKELL